MKTSTVCIPYLVILMLFATMVGCSSRPPERDRDVIEKSSSTTTTVERPVTQEKKRTTTTTTETQQ